jgi:hypothetical protein
MYFESEVQRVIHPLVRLIPRSIWNTYYKDSLVSEEMLSYLNQNAWKSSSFKNLLNIFYANITLADNEFYEKLILHHWPTRSILKAILLTERLELLPYLCLPDEMQLQTVKTFEEDFFSLIASVGALRSLDYLEHLYKGANEPYNPNYKRAYQRACRFAQFPVMEWLNPRLIPSERRLLKNTTPHVRNFQPINLSENTRGALLAAHVADCIDFLQNNPPDNPFYASEVVKSFYLVKEVIRSSPDNAMMDLLRKLLALECTVSALKENKSQSSCPSDVDFFPTEITAVLIQTGNTSALQIMRELVTDINVLFEDLRESIYTNSANTTSNYFLEGMKINLHYPNDRVVSLPYSTLVRGVRPASKDQYNLHILEEHPANLIPFRHQLYIVKRDSVQAYFVNSACQAEPIRLEEDIMNKVLTTEKTTIKITQSQLPVQLMKKPECLLLGHRLGAGCFGDVRQVMFAIKYPRSGKLEIILHGEGGKTRAVKSIPKDKVNMNEFTLGRLAPQLKMKPPLFFTHYSHFPMRKLPGLPLNQLLMKMNRNPGQYPWSFRLALSQKMLKALKSQVLDLDICHQDIKPENIMVHIHEGEIEVNVLDYGLAEKLSTINEPSTSGSPLYSPPEFFLGIKRTAKSDLFSMARVIELIWGENEYDTDSRSMLDIERHVQNITFNRLFKIEGLPELHSDTQERIKSIFEAILRWDERKRLTVEKACELFENVTLLPASDSPRLMSSL